MAIRTYDILLDSYNSAIPEPIVGRQGDKNGAVTLHVTITDRKVAVDLTSQTVNLIAKTANGTAVVADNAGVTLIDAVNGKFDYAVPNALWSEAGKIKKAYFSLNAADGQQTTYDLIFIVKKSIDINQKHADDYVTIIDGTLRDLQSKVNVIDEAYKNGEFYSKSESDAKYQNKLDDHPTDDLPAVETIKMGFLTDSFGVYIGGIKNNYIDYLSSYLSRRRYKVEETRDTIGSTRLTQAIDRSDSFCERIGKFKSGLDYLFIQGGTNDWGANMPLGIIGDTKTTSFYGAIDYLIKQAFAKLPTTQLIFITPTYRGDMASDKNAKNGQGATQTDYIQAIKVVCAKYNVQYIELGDVIGIYPWLNGSSLTVDNLHPNQIGHQRIAHTIVSQLGL